MEELTRVDPNDDPYLALRTALAVAICVILADPLGVTQPMMPVVLGMSLLSNQRGALNARGFAGPVLLPVLAFGFSWVAAATVSEPMLFVLVNVVLAAAGIGLMLFRGSRIGIALTVFPAMMSMSVLYSDQALATIRDSLATGGLVVGGAAVALNILFPPQTRRVHEPQLAPLSTEQPIAALLIRLAVYVPVMLLTYATGDMNLLIVPILLAFVCAEPDRGGRLQQLVDRGGGTVIGALVAVAAMAIYTLVPQFPVLVALIAIVTYFLIDRMTTGTARPLFYQYICSVALVMLLSSTFGARDAFEVVVQRMVLTTGAMLGAIALLSLLEAVFLPRRGAVAGAGARYDRHPSPSEGGGRAEEGVALTVVRGLERMRLAVRLDDQLAVDAGEIGVIGGRSSAGGGSDSRARGRCGGWPTGDARGRWGYGGGFGRGRWTRRTPGAG